MSKPVPVRDRNLQHPSRNNPDPTGPTGPKKNRTNFRTLSIGPRAVLSAVSVTRMGLSWPMTAGPWPKPNPYRNVRFVPKVSVGTISKRWKFILIPTWIRVCIARFVISLLMYQNATSINDMSRTILRRMNLPVEVILGLSWTLINGLWIERKKKNILNLP